MSRCQRVKSGFSFRLFTGFGGLFLAVGSLHFYEPGKAAYLRPQKGAGVL